jgi:hypothetical protein
MRSLEQLKYFRALYQGDIVLLCELLSLPEVIMKKVISIADGYSLILQQI